MVRSNKKNRSWQKTFEIDSNGPAKNTQLGIKENEGVDAYGEVPVLWFFALSLTMSKGLMSWPTAGNGYAPHWRGIVPWANKGFDSHRRFAIIYCRRTQSFQCGDHIIGHWENKGCWQGAQTRSAPGIRISMLLKRSLIHTSPNPLLRIETYVGFVRGSIIGWLAIVFDSCISYWNTKVSVGEEGPSDVDPTLPIVWYNRWLDSWSVCFSKSLSKLFWKRI